MISPVNAYKLAHTKIKSKRVLLWTSIIVASILFATLIAGVVIYTGASRSASTFVSRANDGRYLVRVSPVIPTDVFSYGSDLNSAQVRDIKSYQEAYYAKVRDQYKSLGLKYDASTEVSAFRPSSYKPATTPAELRVDIDYQSPVVKAYFDERMKAYENIAPGRIENLRTTAANYGGSGYYVTSGSGLPIIPSSRLIDNGKEDFSQQDVKTDDLSTYGYFIHAATNGFYDFGDDALLKRYLLTTDTSTLKGVPVILSSQEATRLFGKDKGIGSKPKDASLKASWLRDAQTKLKDQTYQVCYRNEAEQAMLTKIQTDYESDIAGKDDKDYVKSPLAYAYPTTPCGDIIVLRDTRTVAEKKMAADSDAVQKKLGTYQAASHRLVTFQIVGLINAQPFVSNTTNAADFLKNLITINNLTGSAIIPSQMYSVLPADLKVNDLIDTSNYSDALFPRVVSFPSIDQARMFMSKETCPANDTNCSRTYTSEPYGSNYLILEDIGKSFAKVSAIAFPAVLGLSLLIVLFTVSRIMAENRRETAVYRAMGASRYDVASIYLAYVMMIAIRIALLSLILGLITAFVFNKIYSQQLTDVAVSSFGVASGDLRVSLFDPVTPFLLAVPAAILAICILASVPALIRNALRHPGNDLRSE